MVFDLRGGGECDEGGEGGGEQNVRFHGGFLPFYFDAGIAFSVTIIAVARLVGTKVFFAIR